jgi:EAL domain-containing protein (putative c-di-GMP-specific phosphodiesterase class I)
VLCDRFEHGTMCRPAVRVPDRSRNLVVRRSLGGEFDCDVIIEGIEDASSESVARDLGIKFGQGYSFGRPADAP